MVGSRSVQALVALGVLLASPAVAQESPTAPPPSEGEPSPDEPPQSPGEDPPGEPPDDTPPDGAEPEPPGETAPESPPDVTEPEPPDETVPEPPPDEPPPAPPPPSAGPAPVAAFPEAPAPPPSPSASPPAPTAPPPPTPAPPPRTTPPPASPSRTSAAPAATATPAAAPSPASTEGGATEYESPTRDRDDGKDRRALRLGPIVGVGLPNLLSFGGQLKLTRFLGAGVNIGLIPTVQIDYYGQATLKYQEYDAYGRLYPFGNAIFAGAGVGYATVTGIFTERVDLGAYGALDPSLPASLEVRSEGSVQTMVLTPQIGLFKTFKSGFSIGLDVGAQIPIAPSDVKFKTRVPDAVPQPVIDQYVEPNDEQVRSTLDKIGQTPVPTFNFRLGWLL